MSRCILENLASPELQGVLLGLGVVEQKITPDGKSFKCCEGSGLCDDKTGAPVKRCDLRWRLNAVNRVLGSVSRFYELKTSPKEVVVGLKLSPAELSLLKSFQNLKVPPKRAFIFRQRHEERSVLLAMALAGVWRFGLDCQIITFGKQPLKEFKTEGSRPRVLLVDRIQGLSDASHALDLDLLVSYAYHSGCYLCLSLIEQQAPTTLKPGATSKEYFSRKIAALKARPQLEFLSTSARSRLENMCGGVKV